MIPTRFPAGLLAALLIAAAGPVRAQVGATTDILTGVVVNETGQPIADAIVEATSLETQVIRQARTDARGRYMILFPDGGGQYRLVARYIGMVPIERLVVRQADEDRLVTDFALSTTPTRLQEIVVQGRPTVPRQTDLPTPGSIERVVTPDQAARLPLDASDLLVLALLAPGVVQVEGSDTTAAGFSVAGQRPTANAVTLDGMSFGTTSIPQDAVRMTRVITNSYDAGRGQFSGGQIASVTRSGTNVMQGTANYSLRDDDLTVTEGSSDAFTRAFTQHQLSGGLGGPVIRNRLFLFGSVQGRFRSDELQSLLGAPASTLTRLGTSPDSAARFTGVVGGFGLPVTQFESDTRATDSWSGIGRLDWTISNTHSLTARGDWRRSRSDPSRISPLGLPQTGGSQVGSGGGGLVSLTSRFGVAFINEARVYLSRTTSTADPFLHLPQGRVQVASSFADGSQGVSTLTFGGNSGLPTRNESTTLELTEELSWLSAGGAHRLKVGTLYSRSTTLQDATTNRYGTFTFNSLADLEAGRPASFTRTLTPTVREGSSTNGAVYVADVWRTSPQLQLTLGGRLEYSRAGGAAPYEARIEELFGRRTDALPREVHLSPRLGFTWTLGGGPGLIPAAIIRGGLGEFRSPIGTALLATAQNPAAAGLEAQLVCIGTAAPVPDWSAWLQDPGAIPSACVEAGPMPAPTRASTVTVFDPDFGAPRTWRASLGVQRRIGFTSLSADASWARGTSQTGFRDLNLVDAPRFTLADEGDRPVYVPAASIDPGTGAVGFLASRRHAEYGQVLSVDSDLASESVQLSLAANGITRGGIIYQLSWTVARSRDQSSFSGRGAGGGFGSATTAGSPNDREWATSDFDRRHTVVGTATVPFGQSLELSTVARMTSGAPWTPLVGSDINGDGARNDRAFIFDPATAGDPALGEAMERLLESASGGAHACLTRQLGRVAERNSCRGPWQPSLEFQLNWRPSLGGLNRKLLVSVTTVNLLGGLDRMLHGSDDLRGWGTLVRPDATLLYARGFDPATGRFDYAVNERFGSSRAAANAFSTPFQIGFQMRYTLGPDRQREMIQGIRGMRGAGGGLGGGPGGPGGGAGGGGGPAGFLERFESLVPNPARQVLELRLGLRLNDDQVRRLTILGDSTAAMTKGLADSTRAEIGKAGARPDPGRLFAVIRPLLEAGQRNLQAALTATQAILTPEQWNQVPERIRNPTLRFGGPQGQPARRPPGP